MTSRLLHLVPIYLSFALVFTHLHLPPLFHAHLFDVPSTEVLSVVGNLLTAIGMLFSVWARIWIGRNWSAVVTLKEDHGLITTGPYQWVRHPIYTGFTIAFIGTVLVKNEVCGLLALALVVIAYLRKIKTEESLLTKHFGETYRQYQKTSRALLPFVY